MSAEFYVRFDDTEFYDSRAAEILAALARLPTFSFHSGGEVWLRGTDDDDTEHWPFDVRIFVRDEFLLLEISGKPASIERDLTTFLSWLRKQTSIRVLDEDGEPTNW